MSNAKSGDVLAGVVVTALGFYVTGTSLKWELMTPAGPGPGFAPLIYGVLMIALSAVLIARAILIASPAEPGAKGLWAGSARAYGTFGLFLVSIAILPFAGFAISLALLCFAIARGLYRRPTHVALIASVLTSAAFVLIFRFALQVDLPVGWLGF